MRRWVVIVVAAGALVVVLLGWRSFHPMMAQKTCVLNGGRWNAAARLCEPIVDSGLGWLISMEK